AHKNRRTRPGSGTHAQVGPTPTLRANRPWLEHPDENMLVRSARSVCELYSQAVHQAGISNRHSEFRLLCHHDAGRKDVLVTMYPDVTDGFEMAGVSVPPGIADLSAGDGPV
ncbi:hypothetical protein, partial [Actinoplanes sp. GCM10030250]|uniref:hypothetical protein n=1 Tax=Actinoplanes sp. GCM10030250 TaxID=3273376 RepID=UPI003610269C